MARPKTYATCTHCGAAGLAWLRVRNARFEQPGAYAKPWAWILYPPVHEPDGTIRTVDGKAVAASGTPHACAEYSPIAAWMAGESATRPAGLRDSHRKPRRRSETAVQTSQAPMQGAQSPAHESQGDPEPESAQDSPQDPNPQEDPKPMPETVPYPRAVAADLIAQALALVTAQASKAVDRATVEQIVAAAVAEALKPTERTEIITIETRTPEGKTIHRAEITHPNTTRLLRYVQARRHCYVYGPAGSSKTCSAIQAAQLAGLRHAVIPLSQTTTASQLFGFMDAQSNYRPTILRDLYEHGGVLILDEFDNAAGNVAALLNGLLENGRGSFPDGMVQRSVDFVVIATGNTNLRGATRDHSSRTSLDLATVARFAFLDWPYDLDMERQIVEAASPRNAQAILAWCRAVRATLAAERVCMTLAGPREALNIAQDLEQGETFEASADSWVWRGLDPATKDRILARHPYPAQAERKEHAA